MKRIASSVCLFACCLTISNPTIAGNGSLDTDNGELSLNVLLTYPPPQADINTLSQSLQQASEILCDATEGQLRIGEVTIRSGGCESGDCQMGIDQADIYFTPTNNQGAGQASVCADGAPCSSLGRDGANVVLSRFYLDRPAVIAHELGHYVLNLGDAYRQYDCKPHRPPYGELFDCNNLSSTNTSLMLAEDCGDSVDYSELTTDATLPANPQSTCASEASVFSPGGSCSPQDACPDVGGYSANYDGYKNETDSPRVDLCTAFSPSSCEYELSATQWFGFFNHKEFLSEFEQAAKNLASLNSGNAVFDTIVTGVPNSGVPAARAAFCAQQVDIDVQVDVPNQVAMVLDRSWSMAFPRSTEFEKCDPATGCPEICNNGKDDDGDGLNDESDCSDPRMVALKNLSLNYVDFMAAAANEAIKVGVQSFDCSSSIEVEADVITNTLANSTYKPAISNLKANGSTAIADALRDAADRFDDGGNRAILLVTDGFNSCGDSDISGVIQELAEDGIAVDAISFGQAVSSMESAEIAEATGGKFIAAGLATDLGPAFARQWGHRVLAGMLVPQLPYRVEMPPVEAPFDIRNGRTTSATGSIAPDFGRSPDEIGPATIDRFEVLVEAGTSRMMVLLASGQEHYETVGIRARFDGPPGLNGSLFDTDAPGGDPMFAVNQRNAYTIVTLHDPNPGKWTISVMPPGGRQFAREQKGYITVLSQGVQSSFIANVTNRFVSDIDEGTIVTGYARYREAALQDATVRAHVRRPDGSVAEFDVQGGDDPFPETGYFVKFSGADIQTPGRYEVRLSLLATPDTTLLRVGDGQPAQPIPVTLERTIAETFWVLDGDSFACRCADADDCDNDGVFAESSQLDSDGDGHANACDPDSDNDEIPDGWENAGVDNDGDGIPDELDPDGDGNGVIDGDDPDLERCDPPVVLVQDESSDVCLGGLRLQVIMHSGNPVVAADIPVSLPDKGLKVTKVSPGPDALMAGLKSFDVRQSWNPGEFDVSLRFSPDEPLAPGNALHVVTVDLSVESVAATIVGQACPSGLSAPRPRRPELVLLNREGCDATYRDDGKAQEYAHVEIAARSVCGDIVLSSLDADGDGIGGECDNCPFWSNSSQADVDYDGIGNACDAVTSSCTDRIDNDGDGLADALDPGCSWPGDLSELDGRFECDNGIDDDFDGYADALDSQCTKPRDNEIVSSPSLND